MGGCWVIFLVLLPFIFNYSYLLKVQFEELKRSYDLFYHRKNDSRCPKTFKVYLESDKIKDCLPPKSDHDLREGRSQALDVLCLLILKAQIKWTHFVKLEDHQEGIKCNFQSMAGPQ